MEHIDVRTGIPRAELQERREKLLEQVRTRDISSDTMRILAILGGDDEEDDEDEEMDS